VLLRTLLSCHGSTAAPITLALAAASCTSTQTLRTLDRTYDAAQARAKPPNSFGTTVHDSDRELTEALERDFVIAQAVARSPALTVMAHRARALVHEGRADGSLPTAELGIEAWNLPLTHPYTLGQADMYMVELRQRFPASGALDARTRAMAEEAQAMLAELSSEERLVAERAAYAFADCAQALARRSVFSISSSRC